MTWTPNSIRTLRERLGMEVSDFAKLLGVDARSVRRWEGGQARPTGSAEAVMTGLDESLNRAPEAAAAIVALVVGAAAVGGLAYLLVKLIEDFNSKED